MDKLSHLKMKEEISGTVTFWDGSVHRFNVEKCEDGSALDPNFIWQPVFIPKVYFKVPKGTNKMPCKNLKLLSVEIYKTITRECNTMQYCRLVFKQYNTAAICNIYSKIVCYMVIQYTLWFFSPYIHICCSRCCICCSRCTLLSFLTLYN